MDIVIYSFKSIFNNKTRSFLTILGIIVGITSMMVISVIGRAFSDTFMDVTNRLYKSDIMDVNIIPSDENNTYVASPDGYISIPDGVLLDIRKVSDVLKDSEYGNAYISKGYFAGDYTSALYNGKSGNTLIYAACAGETVNGSNMLIKGRQISAADERKSAATAVISDGTERDLFGNDGDALGKQILIKSENTVIPVIVTGVFTDWNYSLYNAGTVLINHSYLEENYNNILDYYYWNRENIEITLDGVEDREAFMKNIVPDLNDILDNSQWQVEVSTRMENLESTRKLVDVILSAVFIIACISLFTGSIGIMSIMIITVTERTNEIGIRKAIGATNSSIILQFLCESMTLSLLGTGTGIISGLIISKVVSIEAGYYLSSQFDMSIVVNTVFPAGMIIITVLTAVIIGIVFGFYPAFRASKMEIVDSLRFE